MEVNRQTLEHVAQQVLEMMAFAMVMPAEESLPEADWVVGSTVRFRGPCSGALTVLMPGDALGELAQNMVGEEGGGLTEQQQHDALGELTNVMCGNLLAEIAGPEPVFDLDAPEVAGVEPSQDEPADCCASVRLTMDDSWVELRLVMNVEAAAVHGHEAKP